MIGTGAKGVKAYARVDEEIDQLIDENFALQEEERKLMAAVKKLQHKKQAGLSFASSKVKKLTKTLGDSRKSESPSRDKPRGDFSQQEFILDASNMRSVLEESNKKIADLKNEIELSRKFSKGQVPSDELINQLR